MTFVPKSVSRASANSSNAPVVASDTTTSKIKGQGNSSKRSELILPQYDDVDDDDDENNHGNGGSLRFFSWSDSDNSTTAVSAPSFVGPRIPAQVAESSRLYTAPLIQPVLVEEETGEPAMVEDYFQDTTPSSSSATDAGSWWQTYTSEEMDEDSGTQRLNARNDNCFQDEQVGNICVSSTIRYARNNEILTGIVR